MNVQWLFTCPICDKEYFVMFSKKDSDKIQAYLNKHRRGEQVGLIQDELAFLTPTYREMLMSEMCEDCQKKFFD